MKLMIGLGVFVSVVPFFLPVGIAYQITFAMGFVFTVHCLVVVVMMWRHRRIEARFHLLGQAIAGGGMLLFGLLLLGVLPYHILLLEGMPLGISVGSLLSRIIHE